MFYHNTRKENALSLRKLIFPNISISSLFSIFLSLEKQWKRKKKNTQIISKQKQWLWGENPYFCENGYLRTRTKTKNDICIHGHIQVSSKAWVELIYLHVCNILDIGHLMQEAPTFICHEKCLNVNSSQTCVSSFRIEEPSAMPTSSQHEHSTYPFFSPPLYYSLFQNTCSCILW